MALSPDLKEFVGLLNAKSVNYLVVGGHAVAFHGRPRFTADLDLFVGTDPANAAKIVRVLTEFGFEELNLQVSDFSPCNEMIQLGVSPNRIDLLTTIPGVDFEECWEARVSGEIEGVPASYISRAHLIRNKRAIGRPIDIADATFLEKLP